MSFVFRYNERMKDWVASALKHSGMSQAELARALASQRNWPENRSIINKIVNGHRDISAQEMMDISEVTGYPAPASEPSPVGTRRVTVSAHVQAGYWAETWEWNDDQKYDVYIPDEPEFRTFKLHAAETRGPSMNKRWPEKTVLVFTDVQETLEEPIPGKRYIVERKRAGGEAEHTVKLLHRDDDGRYWLVPESDDPRFQAPISIEDGTGNEDTVAVIGRVHFSVARE